MTLVSEKQKCKEWKKVSNAMKHFICTNLCKIFNSRKLEMKLNFSTKEEIDLLFNTIILYESQNTPSQLKVLIESQL